jgi:hypothetical protein
VIPYFFNATTIFANSVGNAQNYFADKPYIPVAVYSEKAKSWYCNTNKAVPTKFKVQNIGVEFKLIPILSVNAGTLEIINIMGKPQLSINLNNVLKNKSGGNRYKTHKYRKSKSKSRKSN